MKKIGILGRTNVGKSTLFNRLIKEKKSIVSDIPGTTRDLISANLELGGEEIEIIDFGGFDFGIQEKIEKRVQEKILKEIKNIDLIIFVVDGKCGLIDEDRKIAEILRKTKKEIILAVNKVDSKKIEENVYDFYQFGFDNLVAISAINGRNIIVLFDSINKKLFLNKKSRKILKKKELFKISIIGKPNVGKSSIFNYLYGEEKNIVTDVAGTTRDSIDAEIKINSKKYLFIDTAGLRRKKNIYKELDIASAGKSLTSIKRSDLVFYVVDSNSYITDYDIQLINYAWKIGKSVLIVVNKWDIKPPDMTENKYKENLIIDNSIFKNFSFTFVSAVKGTGFENVTKEIERLEKTTFISLKTSILNKKINEIMLKYNLYGMKFFYATQIGHQPIQILMFVNKKKYFTKKYLDYLEKKLRESFDLFGVPIAIKIRER